VGQVQPNQLRPLPGVSRTCGGLRHACASFYLFRGATARAGTKETYRSARDGWFRTLWKFLAWSASYEAGSAYRIPPHLRSNARAVDRSLALKIRYSDSDGPCSHCTHPSVPRVGQISRQFHRTFSRSPKHATDGRSPSGTPFKSPPRALATSCTRATARAIRVQDALSHRESLDQPILGQLRSSVILVSTTKIPHFKSIISR